MADQIKVNTSTIRLERGDITDYDIEAFVYYAQHDLVLGSGFGTAITMRGGPSVQEELNGMGPLNTTECVVSAAGNMKAEKIIHAVGPRFQEENLDTKLAATIHNVLKLAEEKGIKKIAFPPMGAGFYGVPLDVSAHITLDSIKDHLRNGSSIEEVVIFLLDKRDYKPFQEKIVALGNA